MQLSDFLEAGITTAVGVLGTDTVTRSQVTPIKLLAANYFEQSLLSFLHRCIPTAHVNNARLLVALVGKPWRVLPLMDEAHVTAKSPTALMPSTILSHISSAGELSSQVQGIDGQWYDMLSLVWRLCSTSSNSHWQHSTGHVPYRQLPRCGRGGCL